MLDGPAMSLDFLCGKLNADPTRLFLVPIVFNIISLNDRWPPSLPPVIEGTLAESFRF